MSTAIAADSESRWFDLGRLLADTDCQRIQFLGECQSTNTIGLQQARDFTDLPLLVLTDSQTAGRGRGANSWWASDGAVTFSLLIAPSAAGIAREATPLVSLTKTEIVQLGTKLGVDYSLTHSCYDPDSDGQSCGHCDSCLLRLTGFAEAGLTDPVTYQ